MLWQLELLVVPGTGPAPLQGHPVPSCCTCPSGGALQPCNPSQNQVSSMKKISPALGEWRSFCQQHHVLRDRVLPWNLLHKSHKSLGNLLVFPETLQYSAVPLLGHLLLRYFSFQLHQFNENAMRMLLWDWILRSTCEWRKEVINTYPVWDFCDGARRGSMWLGF